jgi:dihydroneopterin aldolase
MDRLTLRNVRAFGRHGVDDAERRNAQAIDVTLSVELDLEPARRSDDVADTIDYAQLHRRIVDVVSSTSFALLERLAGALLDAAFVDARVRRAEVTVAKPSVLGGATAAVTLTRERR